MESKRVVVTGVGTISPLGNTIRENWENLVAGVSGIGPLTRVNADEYPAKTAGEVKNFEITDIIDRKEARKMDRFTHYAIAASKMAVEDAKLEITPENANRVGVWIGSGIGGMETFEQNMKHFKKEAIVGSVHFLYRCLFRTWLQGKYPYFSELKG